MVNKKVGLIWVVILLCLIFTKAQESRSLTIIPLTPQLRLYATGNWIPPSLPNELKCVGAGCCLIPLAGCLVGREALKKEARLESLPKVKQPKFSIGISYSPGIAYTGTRLSRPFFSPFPDPGKLPEAIISQLYLNNRVELGVRYYVNPKWCLEINTAYMWVRLNGRSPWFSPDTLVEEYWYWSAWEDSCFWEFTTFSVPIGLLYYWVNRKGTKYIGGGLEYNFSKCLAHGKFLRHSQYYYPDTPIVYLEGNALRSGRGMGIFFDIGFNRVITKIFSLNISLTIRHSLAKIGRADLPSWAVLSGEPITYSFTGIYLKVGFTYVLFKHQTRKEKKWGH